MSDFENLPRNERADGCVRRPRTNPRADSAACRCTSGSSSRSAGDSRPAWLWGEGATHLEFLPTLILRALTALAAPLVVLAILSAIVTNEVKGRLGALMMVFYLINTLVAMLIGLTLTNLIRPGIGAAFIEPGAAVPTLCRRKQPPTCCWIWSRGASASRSPRTISPSWSCLLSRSGSGW